VVVVVLVVLVVVLVPDPHGVCMISQSPDPVCVGFAHGQNAGHGLATAGTQSEIALTHRHRQLALQLAVVVVHLAHGLAGLDGLQEV
jgi:hypothetical protein